MQRNLIRPIVSYIVLIITSIYVQIYDYKYSIQILRLEELLIELIKNYIFKAQVDAIIKMKEDSIIRKVTATIIGTKIKDSQLLDS